MIRRLCGLLIILAIADVLLPTKRAATQTIPASKFSLVFSPGVRPAGSWGRAIAAGMRRGNLDGDRCGDYSQIACQAPNYPDVDQDLLSYNIQLAFRASSILELTLAYGSVSAGRVWGYFDGGNTGTADSDAELLLMMHAKTVTLSGRYRLGEFVRIGGGPALRIHETAVTTASDFGRGGRTDRKTTIGLGFGLEAGIAWPARSSVFMDLGARYNWAAATSFGPYAGRNEQDQLRTTMPATQASFAHIGFSAGGHLVAALSTNYDRRLYASVDTADVVSARPDFAVLVYPDTCMTPHGGR